MGGNIFKNKATSISIENIQPTIDAYKQKLGEIFPMKAQAFNFFEPVGSAGKKQESGDLDLAIDSTHIIRHFTEDEIEKWGLDYDEWYEKYRKIHKRSRTATYHMCKMKALLKMIGEKLQEHGIDVENKKTSAGNLFTCFSQYDINGNPTGEYIQIDWMVGDIDWLRWSYYSHGEEGLKGLHRTQFIVACFLKIGMTFSHYSGVKTKGEEEWSITSPSEALRTLSRHYGNITIDRTKTFRDLHSWLLENANKDDYLEVVRRYTGIIKLAKAEIPNEIKEALCYYQS
jgi:hypothetical protein